MSITGQYIQLIRQKDSTGVSGTGLVCEGFIFSNGQVILRWLTGISSIVIHESIENVRKIHCHDGQTYIDYYIISDGEPEAETECSDEYQSDEDESDEDESDEDEDESDDEDEDEDESEDEDEDEDDKDAQDKEDGKIICIKCLTSDKYNCGGCYSSDEEIE